MSINALKKHPLYNAIITGGLLANDNVREALYPGMSLDQAFNRGRKSRFIRTTQDFRDEVLSLESTGLSFSYVDIQSNTAKLRDIVNKNISTKGVATILNKNTFSESQLKNSKNAIFALDYSSGAWAREAQQYVARYIESVVAKGRGWQIVGADKKIDPDKWKLYYPAESLIVFRQHSKLRVPSKSLQGVIGGLKAQARADLKNAQGTELRTVKQLLAAKNKGGQYLPEICFWLNGVLDIKSLESNFTGKARGIRLNQLSGISGVQIGDVSEASAAEPVLEAILASSNIGPNHELKTVSRKILKDIQVDISLEKITELSKAAGFKENVLFTFLETGNSLKGSQTGGSVRRLVNLIDKSPELAQYVKDALNLPGSKSKFELIDDYLVSLFLTGKTKPGTKSKQRGRPTKLKLKYKPTPIHSLQRTSSRTNDRTREQKEVAANVLDLETILEVLNSNLATYLKRNMGKGNAPVRLNWQTGRFGRSAAVTNLTTTRGRSIEAWVTYLRYPYDVFLPGGRLHNQLRDPEKLIGKSVRQILSEQLGLSPSIRTRLV